MATVHLSPVGNGFQFLSANVIPSLALGKIYTYGAGTTTPQDTYTTLAGNVKNANPIVLNSDGRPPQEIWLVEGFAYRFDLFDAAGNLIQTLDNLYGINDLSVNAGPLPATAISFVQAGSGAVTRTGQSKMREWFSPEDFGAVGNGSTNDTAAFNLLLTAAAGQEIRLGAKTYLITSSLAIPANTTLAGEGPTSIIKATSDIQLLTIATAGVTIRGIKFVGFNGADVQLNAGVIFKTGASNGLIEDCYLTGMAGWPIWCDSCDTITIRRNYITALGTPLNDSAAIALYTNTERCLVEGNTCIDGGSNTWQGIIMQVGAKRNRIVNNVITGYYAYGILDYQPTPQQTDNIITGNTIRDINGGPAILGGNSGAGIYLNSCGGDVVANNNISNTNTGTTTESLAPGAIGVATAFSENNIIGNVINVPVWYGIRISTNGTVPTNIVGNQIQEAALGAIKITASSNTNISGNRISQITTAPQSVSAISINAVGGIGPNTNVSVTNNNIVGAGSVVIYMRDIQKGVIANNTVALAKSIACKIQDSDYVAVSGNYFEVTVATVFYALQLDAATYCRVSNNVLKSAYASGAFATSGTCTGGFFDRSNVIVGSDKASADCSGTGFRTEMISDNLGSLNSRAGDLVYYTAPASGAFIGQVCTVAGTPGTWKTFGVIS